MSASYQHDPRGCTRVATDTIHVLAARLSDPLVQVCGLRSHLHLRTQHHSETLVYDCVIAKVYAR